MALAAGLPLSLARSAATESLIGGPTTQLLTKKDFAACLNSEFVIQNAGNKVKTKLVDVADLPRPAHVASGDKEGFSLVFQGDRSRELKQNTYIIEHPKLGKFSFLLVPSPHADKGRNYYMATVNRLFP